MCAHMLRDTVPQPGQEVSVLVTYDVIITQPWLR